MKTPWLQANYRKLPSELYDIQSNAAEEVTIIRRDDDNIRFLLTKEQFDDYENDILDKLTLEHMYYRGLAADDCGETLQLKGLSHNKKQYKPLPKEQYVTFKIRTDLNEYVVLLNPEVGSWVALNYDEFADYQAGLLSPLQMESLFLRKLAVVDDCELVEYDFPQPADFPSVVVVNITMACNLKCKYCFAACEPGTGEYMSTHVMRRIIEEMFQMPSKKITFELQGGEPLCNLEGMKDFVKIAEEMTVKYDKIAKYRTVTNGTLVTDDFIEFAKQYDIAVCVSLDGDKDMTNQTRVYSDGRGAYNEIMNGVKKLQEQYQIDGAVCTVGQHNMQEAERIVNFFNECGISFKPRPANVLGRELENETTTKAGEWADLYIKMHKLSRDASVENFSVHIYEENVYGPIRDYICLRYPCGAAREVISVNPNGDVFPCDGFKNEPEFLMGNILTQSLREILAKPDVSKLRARTHKDINKCSKCPFRAMCCSCCYSAWGAFGDIYREDPQCEDRRKIFVFLIKTWLEENE